MVSWNSSSCLDFETKRTKTLIISLNCSNCSSPDWEMMLEVELDLKAHESQYEFKNINCTYRLLQNIERFLGILFHNLWTRNFEFSLYDEVTSSSIVCQLPHLACRFSTSIFTTPWHRDLYHLNDCILRALLDLHDLCAFPPFPEFRALLLFKLTFYGEIAPENWMGQTLKSCQGILMSYEFFAEFHWEVWEFNWKLKVPVQTGTEPGRQVAKVMTQTRPKPGRWPGFLFKVVF